MKRFTMTWMALCAITFAKAQIATFENLTVTATDSSWNGGPGTTSNDSVFLSGNIGFKNTYTWDTSFGGYSYWSGFGFSQKTDTVSVSYTTNEMSAIAGSGYNSTTYGVAYVSPFAVQHNRILLPTTSAPKQMRVTNSTIAYRSMQNGDGLAKKFGGANGNDPDFLRLDITGWLNGSPKTDTVKFYLADYRDANNMNDYIVKDWRLVDLTTLGMCDSLTFSMVSSDNNINGMLTPSYFCLDDFVITPSSVWDLNLTQIAKVFPNPFTNDLNIQNNFTKPMLLKLFDMKGQLIGEKNLNAGEKSIWNLQDLASGNYLITTMIDNQIYSMKLLK